MFFDDHTIESEYIEIECFLTANIIQSGCIQIECSFIHCISNLFFNHYSMSVNTPRAAGYSESDDDSSEDGCVGEKSDDKDENYENMSTGGDESADGDEFADGDESAEQGTTEKHPDRDSIICCHYDPPILTFDSSDWRVITDARGRHFAIGVDSFNKDTAYYTDNNSPADVFGALTFMMSATLEHHSVSDQNSGLIDTLLVKIKQSSYPKDNRTPDSIHNNCFGKPNKSFCRFVIEYIAMSLFFDYWGGHCASHGPAPYNSVSSYSVLLHIKLNVCKLNRFYFKCCTVFRTRRLCHSSMMESNGI